MQSGIEPGFHRGMTTDADDDDAAERFTQAIFEKLRLYESRFYQGFQRYLRVFLKTEASTSFLT
jgi:hypothetical protein